MNIEDHRYIYGAEVEKVYDGDTVTFRVSQGFGDYKEGHTCRLYGMNAPEVRGAQREQGLISRDWLRERLPLGTEVVIKSHRDKTGKYGRWLATIYKDGVNLNEEMVKLGLAEVNYYGNPPDS